MKWGLMHRLLLQGDKVKLTITFKGREMQFQDIGRDLFKVCFAIRLHQCNGLM